MIKKLIPLGNWLYRHRVELLFNVITLVTVPLIAKWLWLRYESGIRQFGLGELFSRVAGNGGWTDIGWEAASTAGWLHPAYSAYDSLETLHPLIGMVVPFVDVSSHSHPPTSIPLGLPFMLLPYKLWLPLFVVLSYLFIGWSMRLLRVPPYIAYSLAFVVALSVPGRWALVSTYPLSAFLVAFAWSRRNQWLMAGLAYGLFGAARGLGYLLLLYPISRKQFKTVTVSIAVGFLLLLAAVVVEPTVVRDFITVSLASTDALMQRSDLLSVGSLFRRFDYPESLAWVLSALIAAVAWRRGTSLFWSLNWLIIAVSPIVWFHTVIAAVPLLVMMWKSGRLGQVLVLLVAASQMTQLVDPYVTLVYSIGPIVVVAAGAIAILSGSVGKNLDPPLALPLLQRARRDSNP